MNNIYKSIWNNSLGSWVAVSEVAGAKGKQSKSSKTGKIAGAFALTLLSAATSSAWAQCTSFSGSSTGVNCSATGDTTLEANGVTSTGTIRMNVTGGSAVMNITDSNITATDAAYGVYANGDGVDINFTGTNTIHPGVVNTGVLATNNYGSTKDMSVNISGAFNLTNTTSSAIKHANDGVKLLNYEGGDSKLIFNGHGKVETNSGNALFIINYGTANTSTINVKGTGGTVELVTNNDGASGIFALNRSENKTGHINITSDAKITTNGLGAVVGDMNLGKIFANGIAAVIRAADSTGTINVNHNGSISTLGVEASGIRAESAGSGRITINNSGQISTVGEKSVGIFSAGRGVSEIINAGVITTKDQWAYGIHSLTYDDRTMIMNTAAITTEGLQSHGIYTTAVDAETAISNFATIITSGSDASAIRADHDPDSISGDIAITTWASSYLETNAEKADGIHATIGSEQLGHGTGASSGSITIHAEGSIKTAGLKTAEGIYAAILKPGSTGNITVAFLGETIETTGAEVNRGIYARQDGSGDVTVSHAGKLISTAGDGAYGIHALTQTGVTAGKVAVNIAKDSKISTLGKESHGIFVASSNDTQSITVVNEGDITVDGATASAIKVASQGAGDVYIYHQAGATVTSTGNNLVNTGAIRTDAITAGKLGVAATGDVLIKSSGNITTEGANRAAGIYGYNQGSGSVTVAASGNITASATNKAGENGDITSIYSYGIGALVSDNANATGGAGISYHAGTIETAGIEGHALYAGLYNTKTGTAIVSNSGDGTLITTGEKSYGIWSRDETLEGGKALAANMGTISTEGAEAHGIYANSLKGYAEILNSGDIKTQGKQSTGILATTGGAGAIVIENRGSIKTNYDDADPTGVVKNASRGISAIAAGSGGIIINNILAAGQSIQTNGSNTAHAIQAQVNTTGASDGIEINQTGGKLETKGYDGHGIFALSNATSGNINVRLIDTIVDLKGRNSDGIDVQRLGASASNLDIDIFTQRGSITLVDPSVALGSSANFGIIAYQYGQAAGNINIANHGTAITTRAGADGTSDASIAIEAQFKDSTATGNIDIINTGVLSSVGTTAKGIRAINAGTGKVDIFNGGAITTKGESAAGISATTTRGGAIKITNQATLIDTTGKLAHGIEATSADATQGDILVENYGNITTKDARGIYLINANGAVTVQARGNITTEQATADTHNHGIDAGTLHGNSSVIFDQGSIKVTGTSTAGGNAIGIAAWDRGSGAADMNASVIVGPTATVDASAGVTGIQIRSNGVSKVTIYQGAEVHGGTGQGIELKSTGTSAAQYTVENAGLIDSLNDRAISSENATAVGTTFALNNTGTITGYMTLSDEDTIFTNDSSNSWNIRHFADTDGDGIRETKQVAISDFGGGTDTLINTANGAIRLAGFTGETSTLTTGEYVPMGALSSINPGIVQGQMLNLNRFENAGLIDLTANGQAGDVLVISGGNTAGTYGGGEYISNGGTIRFDTVLNEGGTASLSDVLVLDDVSKGSRATKVLVNPVAASVGGLTQGEGIKLIEVLGTQDTTAFVLGAPVTYGTSEYLLYSDDGAGVQNGWYLRNYGIGGGGGYQEFKNPNIGAYLGNQYAASNMFNQNILDRRDNVRAPDQNVWLRANHNQVKTDMLDGLQHAKIKTNLFQLGADVIKHNDIVVGVYAGYGDSQVKNRSNQTGTKADGSVTGYHVGAYGSWMPEESKGPYVDVWGHYGWYKNKLEGASQRYDSVKYDSKGYSLSAEVGYGFELAKDKSERAWILEPHLQGIYSKLDSDSFLDKNLTYYSDSKSNGVQTRLGARFYGQHTAQGKKGVLPFIEANWLNNSAKNEVRMNYENTSSKVGKNVGEVKVGLQGNVSEKLSLFSHVGAQQGSSNFKRYEFQFGLNYNW